MICCLWWLVYDRMACWVYISPVVVSATSIGFTKLHQQKPIPEVHGLLMTAVVLQPDSEIVAPFSVSGG